jgi:threonine dehydrogenase-like Zn-dependent dehydrogenase
MIAASIAEPRTTVLVRTEMPNPGPADVRIRVEGCGLCSSSLPVWEGRDWFRYPLSAGEPGHEGWGTIDALGSGVAGLQIGERVSMVSFRALAQYDVAPANAVIRLPTHLPSSFFPGEALGCAMNIFARSDIRPGHTVAVIGVGFLGALLCQLASHAGAKVIGVSRRPFALALARQFGAAETIKLDEHWKRTAETIMAATEGKGCERAIEAVGQQSTLDLAAEVLCERGRLTIAGYHQDGTRQVNMQQWNWRGIDVVNAHERNVDTYVQGIHAAVNAISKGILDPSMLYTHKFGLDEIDQAFSMIRRRPEGFVKALIVT